MSNTSEFSLETARRAAEDDTLNEWVRDFLSSPGSDNAPLAAELTDPPRSWVGPLELPIEELHRLAGPPDHPVLCPVDDDEWRDDVDDMSERIDDEGWDPPPLIVTFRDDQLVLEDGNHRVEGLRRAGEHRAWSIVGFEDQADRDRFVAR